MGRQVGYEVPSVWVGGKKRCYRCKELKSYSDFSKNSHLPKGITADCRVCRQEASRRYKRSPKGIAKARELSLRKKYGLTNGGFLLLLTKQNNCCALCGDKTPGGRYNQWHVDHDHGHQKRTGKVKIRGLLCNACNQGLGLFKDSATRLLNAALYLNKTEKSFLCNSEIPQGLPLIKVTAFRSPSGWVNQLTPA